MVCPMTTQQILTLCFHLDGASTHVIALQVLLERCSLAASAVETWLATAQFQAVRRASGCIYVLTYTIQHKYSSARVRACVCWEDLD
jgi:hypothetical protein